MSPHNWIDRESACDSVYLYQASLLCEDCGEEIRADLRKSGKAPDDEDDDESFDSDDFPKGPFADGGGEADGVQHCDSNAKCRNSITLPCGSKIGAWLGNDLTDDGARKLAESIRKSIFKSDLHGRQVGRFWRIKYSNTLSDLNSVEPVTGRSLASPLVQEFLLSIGGQQPQIVNQVWCDLDCLYGFSMQKKITNWKQPAALIVWKSDILPDGSLGKPSKVELPVTEAQEREAQDILVELIGDSAWD